MKFKPLLVWFVFLLSATSGFSQKSKQTTLITEIGENRYAIVEKRKDHILMEGELQSVKPLVREGAFKFYHKRGWLFAEGSYKNNKPTGIWHYYDKHGSIEHELDYTQAWEALTQEPKDLGEVYFVVEDMPTFRGESKKEFEKYLADHLVYPAYARVKGIEGKVHINFTLDRKGNICNVDFIKSHANEDLNMEALRLIISDPDWTPGYQQRKEVPVSMTIPVLFEL